MISLRNEKKILNHSYYPFVSRILKRTCVFEFILTCESIYVFIIKHPCYSVDHTCNNTLARTWNIPDNIRVNIAFTYWSNVHFEHHKISSEWISFGSKEHVKETEIADSVLLNLFMYSNVIVQHCPRPLAATSAELYIQTDSKWAQ